ncbi:hypothetical protein DFS34DRAFT_657441 [Phlyctochytrium arcticum]|nr:hypothetical protein DFS34DRAFT_657441 [Phlyctochytrium arcticum]
MAKRKGKESMTKKNKRQRQLMQEQIQHEIITAAKKRQGRMEERRSNVDRTRQIYDVEEGREIRNQLNALREYRARQQPIRQNTLHNMGFEIIRVPYIGKNAVTQRLQRIHQQMMFAYKINFSFAYTLQNTETKEFKVYYPSTNTEVFRTAFAVLNDVDHRTAMNRFWEYVNEISDNVPRPNTKYRFIRLNDVFVYRTAMDQRIGCGTIIPNWALSSKSLACFAKIPYNLCFWACVAAGLDNGTEKDYDRYTAKAKLQWKQYYNKKKFNNEYEGFQYADLSKAEAKFNCRIYVNEVYENKTIKMLRCPERTEGTEIHLAYFTEEESEKHHFALITKRNVFANGYKCDKSKAKVVFEDGYYTPSRNIMKEIQDLNIEVPYTDYPLFYGFDTETYVVEDTGPGWDAGSKEGYGLKKLGYLSLMSVSFAYSFKGVISKPEFFSIADEPGKTLDSENVLRRFVNKMTYSRGICVAIIMKDFEQVIQNIKIHYGEDEKSAYRMIDRLMRWIEEVPVYGFNSSSFDMNVVKHDLLKILQEFQKTKGVRSLAEQQFGKELLKKYPAEKIRQGKQHS